MVAGRRVLQTCTSDGYTRALDVDGAWWICLEPVVVGKNAWERTCHIMEINGIQWFYCFVFFRGRRGFSRSRIRGILKHSLEAACEAQASWEWISQHITTLQHLQHRFKIWWSLHGLEQITDYWMACNGMLQAILDTWGCGAVPPINWLCSHTCRGHIMLYHVISYIMLYPSLCSLLPLLYHSTPIAPPSTVYTLYSLLTGPSLRYWRVVRLQWLHVLILII